MTRHLYVTGTDTGVGKTRVTAALARAARDADIGNVEVVKLVQTGLGKHERGDAQDAAAVAGCMWRELHRFRLPADPWTAALAEGVEPLRAAALAAEIAALPHASILEGSGGAAIPLNASESLTDAARASACEAVLVVGLRLGCINHAMLTLAYLAQRGLSVRGAVLCEAWTSTDPAYRLQVERALAPHVRIAAVIPFAPDARDGIGADARRVASLAEGLPERNPAAPR